MQLEQNHIIQTQVFEIGFPNREEVTDVQNRLSQLFNTRLSQVMAGLFDKHIPNDLLLKIDTFEIDLGNISYAHFEDQLAEKFTTELEKELNDRLMFLKNTASANTPGMQVSEFKTSFTDLLEYFLINGSMPWWATSISATDPEKIIGYLLSENPSAIKQLLLKTGQNPNVRRRLVYQFSETIIRSVISILEPEEVIFIFEYYQNIIHFQQQKQVVQSESSGFEKEVMVFIVSAILVDRGSNFNKKMFVKSTLRQMAAHYSVSYESLLFLFSSGVNRTIEQIKKTDYFPVIILELFSEYLQSQNAAPSGEIPVPEKKTDIRGRIEILRHYLFLGSVPGWSGSFEQEELRDLFSELLIVAPLSVHELLVLAIRQKNSGTRFVRLTDERIFTQIVRSVEAEDSQFILEYAGIFIKFLTKLNIGTVDAEVNQSVREFILTFLFSDRSPVSDKQIFLESILRQAARRYDKRFSTLLVYLVQFMSEDYKQEEGHTALFYLITGILKTEGITDDPAKIRSGIREKNAKQKDLALPSSTSQNILLRDALNYFLMHGYLPWWGKDYFSGSPEKMLSELIENFPEDAFLLLKLAGTQTFTRQRFLTQFSPGTVMKLFKPLTGAADALELYDILITFTESYTGSNIRAGSDMLLLAFWNTYEAENYHHFQTPLFFEKFLLQLSLRTKAPVETILEAFKREIHRDRLQKFPDLYAWPLPIFSDRAHSDTFHTGSDEGQLIDLVKSSLPADAQIGRELFLATAMDILSYFLTWNKLPDQLKHIQGARQEAFLKQLLVWLSTENPSALKNAMKSSGLSSRAKMRVHEVFVLEANISERNAKTLLSEFTERDILHYLREHSLRDQVDDVGLRELLDAVFDQNNTTEKREIRRLILNTGNFTRTLAWQLSDEKFYSFLQNTGHGINPEVMDVLKNLQDFLRSAISETLEREKVNALFKEFSLYYFTRQNVDTRSSEFLSAFFKFLASRKHPETLGLFSLLLESGARVSRSSPLVLSGNMDEIQRHLRQYLTFENKNNALVRDLKKSADQALKRLDPDTLNLQKPDPQFLQTNADIPADEIHEQTLNKLLKDEREKIYIRNAGLILLHPFISTFFKRAGLTENGNFITVEARHRAAYLLQYLAYGTNGYAEHEMTLNKVLCGFPLQQPLLPELIPSTIEMEIAEELLLEVTRQWDKLKNTSVAGLQASFLQRNGVLTQTEEIWNMKIEQRGYDVLLQTLPWSFGMVKTPWMTKFLYVEWI